MILKHKASRNFAWKAPCPKAPYLLATQYASLINAQALQFVILATKFENSGARFTNYVYYPSGGLCVDFIIHKSFRIPDGSLQPDIIERMWSAALVALASGWVTDSGSSSG